MKKNKFLPYIMLLLIMFNLIMPLPITHANSSLDNVLATLASSTINNQTNNSTNIENNQNPLQNLLGLLFNKLLGPVLNIFNTKPTTNNSKPTINSAPLTPIISNSGTLNGKVIVIDPGHGGSNPGAVANNTRESDNNLAVGLKVRDKLMQTGAKVIMTRDADRTVAPEGSSLGTELEARVNLAKTNNADIFVSIHSNDNPDTNIAGAMTFYPSGKSSTLASKIESSIITATNAVNKGTDPATFYVLRNSTVPSTLIEMGFVSNKSESAALNNDVYRDKMAEGIFSGIIKYFSS